jgi:glycosyltransferase involved in cell wall biosynthesis
MPAAPETKRRRHPLRDVHLANNPKEDAIPRPMKILIINWQDRTNPDAGGAEVHLHEIFSRVAALGHQVTLYCSTYPGARPEETIDGIRVIREGGRNVFNFYVPYRYRTRFLREGYDVVIDDMNKIPFFTPLYVRTAHVGLIHHLFDKSIFLETLFPLAAYVYLMERWAIALFRRRATTILAVSPSTKSELMAKGIRQESIRIVQNCVDHVTHTPDESGRSATPLVGYFGRLKRYKSVEHLLQAFPAVRARVPGEKLVVVGEGDHRPELERLAASLGIADDVRFTGFVSEQEKVRLLREVWFVVNTSSKEGWGLTVIEANACRTAVVGSNVPGLRDAIRDRETGLLYPFGDIHDLEAKVVRLLENESERTVLASQAYAWSLTFDWSLVAQRTVEILSEELLAKGR